MGFLTGIIAGALGLAAGTIGYAIVGSLVSVGVSLGLSYLSSKMLGRKKRRQYSAVSGDIQVGGAVDVQAAFGQVAVAGYRACYAAFGSGNQYNSEVLVFSMGHCDGLEPYVWINGGKKSLITRQRIGGEAAHYDIEGFEGLFSIRFYDGRPGQTADMKLVRDTASSGNPWKATSTGVNLCYAVVERKYDRIFRGRRPEILWVLRGLRCYDPRKDSTFPGGSGSHRLADASTWAFTRNPAIQRLNYQLGFKGTHSGVPRIGMGRHLSQLDMNSYIAAANVCDQVRRVRGRDIKTYHCNLIALSGDDHAQILKEFDDAMAGYGLNRGGRSGVLAGAPQIVTRTITDTDIRTNGAITLQNRRSAFEQVNHLSGQFTSPESMFQPESLEPITSPADVTRDGRLRTRTHDFLQVSDAMIAQYLLTIRYRQNRLGARVTLPISARLWFGIEAGEWVNYDEKTWLVTEKKAGNLTLAETSAEIYAEGGISSGPVIVPPSVPVNPSLLTTVRAFRANAGILRSADGSQQPALEFRWKPVDDPSIIRVMIEYRREGGEQTHTATSDQPETGILTTSQNIVSGSTYTCRATIHTRPDRFRTFTPWITTAVATVDATVFLRQMQDDMRELLIRNREEMDRLRNILVVEGSQSSTLEAGNSYLARRTLQKTADHALARVARVEKARIEDQKSTASLVEQVMAQKDNMLADGLFRVAAVASPEGVDARLALFVRADDGEEFREAGMFLEASLDKNGGHSGITMAADKFVIGDGSAKAAPFSVRDGQIIFDGVIRSPDGKRMIDPKGSTFIFLET